MGYFYAFPRSVCANGRIIVFQRVILMMKNPELAKQMRLLRKTNNYTQQQIADILQIDRTTYTAYELCKNTPDIMLLDAFAKIFSVSIDYILNIDTQHPEKLCDNKTVYQTARAESLVSELTRDERELLAGYRLLDDKGKRKVRRTVDNCNPLQSK